jgi:hypothetical protein
MKYLHSHSQARDKVFRRPIESCTGSLFRLFAMLIVSELLPKLIGHRFWNVLGKQAFAQAISVIVALSVLKWFRWIAQVGCLLYVVRHLKAKPFHGTCNFQLKGKSQKWEWLHSSFLPFAASIQILMISKCICIEDVISRSCLHCSSEDLMIFRAIDQLRRGKKAKSQVSTNGRKIFRMLRGQWPK